MKLLYLLSVWIHIVAAAFWVGGSLFIAILFVPALRTPEFRESGTSFLRWIALRFRKYVWLCFLLLIISGLFNLQIRYGWSTLLSSEFWKSPLGYVLGLKLLGMTCILLLSAAHDFYIGPKAAEVLRKNPASHEAKIARKQASWVGRVNLLLGLFLFALGIILVRGWV